MKLSRNLHRAATAILVSASAMAYAGAALAIEPGTLVVAHDTDPDDATLFTYMVDGETPGGAGLDDDPTLINGYDNVINTKTFAVTPGDYTVSQGDPGPGWALDAIKCNGPTPAFADLANRKISLNVAPGTEITCRFYNKRTQQPMARIRIIKAAIPDHLQDFGFTGSGPGFAQAFTLDDDGAVPGADNTYQNTKIFNVPTGQQYVFTEGLASPWVLTGIACTPAVAAVVDQPGRKVTITPVAGQTVTCTFRNKLAAPLRCTGPYPLSAVVNLFVPVWTPINICRGGTVTFQKSSGNGFTVTPTVVPAGTFTSIPLAAGSSSGTTGPFSNPGSTPLTFKYSTIPPVPQGTIIVH